MQIGELAKRTMLTVDAIRFYERRELLPKAMRRIEYHQAADSMVALDNGREIVMSSASAFFLLIQPTRYLAKLRATVP